MNDIKYISEWTREHTTHVNLKLNLAADADIIEWLSEVKSKNGAIKEAIRAYMAQGIEAK